MQENEGNASRDGVIVGKGLGMTGITDPYALGTDHIRAVYYGELPELWLLAALDTLDTQSWKVKEYHCYNQLDRAELTAKRGDLPRLGIIEIGIDLFVPVLDDPDARVQVESQSMYLTCRDRFLTWGRRIPDGEPTFTAARSDPPDGRPTEGGDDPRSGTGSPEADSGEPVGATLPDTNPGVR